MRTDMLLLIIGMGVVTYITRRFFIGAAKHAPLHPMVIRLLEYVPVAVLSVLVVPAIVAPEQRLALNLDNVFIIGAVVTALGLLLFKKQWFAIILGVVTVVLIRVM